MGITCGARCKFFLPFSCVCAKFSVPLHPQTHGSVMKGALEHTELGWRKATDTTRHHRERKWDYKGKGIYHLTLTIAERYPLFGELVGDTPEL